MLSNTLKLKFFYLKIIQILHSSYHPKITGYIPKNHTHAKKVGTPQNLFLAFIDELEKQLLIKLLKWVNEKGKNFNIYNVVFKKIK